MRVLIADDFEDIRTLLEFVFSAELGFHTVLVESGQQAIDVLQKDAAFDLIVSDLNMPNGTGIDLYNYYHKRGLHFPFVILSSDHPDQHPVLKSAPIHWISKPFMVDDVVARIRQIVGGTQAPTDSYVPVALNLLKRMEQIDLPLFVRINDHKYVKVTSGPSVFLEVDYDKYVHRGLRYLYIESQHADEFISVYRKKILSIGAWHEASAEDHETISLNIELLKSMSNLLGWDNRTVDLAKQSIHKALHLVKTNPSLHNVLNQFHKIERYGFADHCTVSLLISAGLLKAMGYSDETSMAKITFASVLHDLNLSDEQYEHKSKIIKKLLRGENSSHDSNVVWNHATKAAELCRGWDFCPPDTDLMIQNHHERPDGSGFPNARTASDMDFMTSLFIIAEDFSDCFIEAFGKPDLQAFLNSRRDLYNRGHFKSIFKTLEASIQMQLSKAS